MTYMEMAMNEEKYQKIYVADNTFHTYYAEYEDYLIYQVNL